MQLLHILQAIAAIFMAGAGTATGQNQPVSFPNNNDPQHPTFIIRGPITPQSSVVFQDDYAQSNYGGGSSVGPGGHSSIPSSSIVTIGDRLNGHHQHTPNPRPASGGVIQGSPLRREQTGGGGRGGGIFPRTWRTPIKPPCSITEDDTPCVDDVDYSSDVQTQFDSLLLNSRLNSIINDDIFGDLLNDTEPSPSSVPQTRLGDIIQENPACFALETIIYPKRAKTRKDDWAFILNQGTTRQGVRVEKCYKEGSKCELGFGQVDTIQTSCRQKFIYRKMLIMDTGGDKIVPESVLMPSCCLCYIRKTELNLVPRTFGIPNITSTRPDTPPSTPSFKPSVPIRPTSQVRPSSSSQPQSSFLGNSNHPNFLPTNQRGPQNRISFNQNFNPNGRTDSLSFHRPRPIFTQLNNGF